MSGITSWNAASIEQKVRTGAWLGVLRAIGIVEAEAVRLITQTPKSGKVYRRRGVEHRASAPGESPASDLGDLVNTRSIEQDFAALRASLVFRSAHALPLEVGTARMAARPYARQALLNSTSGIMSAIREEVRAALA